MKISHYSVFAAAPGGGKQFAIVEDVSDPAEMRRIAAQTGQPLTGFILDVDSSSAEVRFFSPTKEKGSSDSGALVVGEHLRRAGRAGEKLTVQMREEGLEVFYEKDTYDSRLDKVYSVDVWWTRQGDTRWIKPAFDVNELRSALGLQSVEASGLAGAEKVNAMFAVKDTHDLDHLRVNFEILAEKQIQLGLNGVVVFCSVTGQNGRRLRFFAPAKGLMEDNAGSFTVASLCSFLTPKKAPKFAWEKEVVFLQGEAMGKPSKLLARYQEGGREAKNIRIGGKVELLGVTEWA